MSTRGTQKFLYNNLGNFYNMLPLKVVNPLPCTYKLPPGEHTLLWRSCIHELPAWEDSTSKGAGTDVNSWSYREDQNK